MGDKKILWAVLTLLFSVLAWVWSQTFVKLTEIEAGLTKVRLDLVQIQSQMMTVEQVRAIVEHELLKRGK